MAVIADQVPPPAPLPADFKARVVVKFRPDVRLPYTGAAVDTLTKQPGRSWGELRRPFQRGAGALLASIGEATLQGSPSETRGSSQRPATTVHLMLRRRVSARHRSRTGRQRARHLAERGDHYVRAARPRRRSTHPTTRAMPIRAISTRPGGIDARWPGRRWARRHRIVDMERDWTLNHEDLAAAGIAVISASPDYHGPWHGRVGRCWASTTPSAGSASRPARPAASSAVAHRVDLQHRGRDPERRRRDERATCAAEAQTSYPTVSICSVGRAGGVRRHSICDFHGIVVVEAGPTARST